MSATFAALLRITSMKISGGIKIGGTRIAIGMLLLISTQALAPPAVAQDVFAGACEITLEVTYSPALKLAVPMGATTVSVDGDGTCDTTTHGTVDATLTAEGTTTALTASTFTCAGGVVVGTGTFNVQATGYPTNQEGPAVITLDGKVATVTIKSDNPLTVTASGAFTQPLPTAATCSSPTGFATTTWTGVVVFAATEDVPLPTGITKGSDAPR